jgi:hypothetical protein
MGESQQEIFRQAAWQVDALELATSVAHPSLPVPARLADSRPAR